MTCDPADFTVLTVPERFAAAGDPHTAMDVNAGRLDALLDLAARDEAEGLGDAPWPPHFAKQQGEGKRVAPSRAKQFSDQLKEGFGEHRFRKASQKKAPAPMGIESESASPKPKRGARVPKMPLVTIAQSPDKTAAEAGFQRWKAKYPEVAGHLAPDDVLLDRMRGSAYVWYRIRVNLRNVPESLRPPQEPLDPDDGPARKSGERK
jgi:hypothetical protein